VTGTPGYRYTTRDDGLKRAVERRRNDDDGRGCLAAIVIIIEVVFIITALMSFCGNDDYYCPCPQPDAEVHHVHE
jgi:hypothetical protein